MAIIHVIVKGKVGMIIMTLSLVIAAAEIASIVVVVLVVIVVTEVMIATYDLSSFNSENHVKK